MQSSPRSLFNGAPSPKCLASGSADLLPHLCVLKTLKYTKYSFGFQNFICAKISRSPVDNPIFSKVPE
jgi:hypothetical protein